MKYGNARRFECWRWDDQFIYHAVDHGLDGDSNESYTFTDGRWLARYLPAGATASAPWVMDVPQNQMVWFDAACRVDPARSHAFPYRQRAWFEPRRDAGPDARRARHAGPRVSAVRSGRRDRRRRALLFRLGAGWYEWERSGFHDFFNRDRRVQRVDGSQRVVVPPPSVDG